jgi:RNA polymerase sigma factor (sigma-70 family)
MDGVMDEMSRTDLALFEETRASLIGLAYRILGSRADAEDVVQDCFIRWSEAHRRAIDRPAAWLTTVCTRRCLDILRSADRKRVDYVGPWLPEPIHTAAPAPEPELAGSLTTAFLLMLERLSPKERAAYLLHDIFERSYADVASALDIEEAACRQLVSRARGHIDRDKTRYVTPLEVQDRLLGAFHSAIESGNPAELSALLSSGARLTSDGGGKVSAARRVLEGDDLVTFLMHVARWWREFSWVFVDMNGGRGAILTHDGAPQLTVTFGYDAQGRIDEIFIMRNPDKLARLDPVAVH